MNQNERWQLKYDVLMAFMKKNIEDHRSMILKKEVSIVIGYIIIKIV